MNIGENYSLYFIYDATGPMALKVTNGTASTTYYYAKNLQGDIVAILNKAGKAVVEYTYDAWGNIVSIEGDYKNGLGLRNPLLYRGYVYDRETKLYYLQSRYYDPAMGRFLNADAYTSTGQGIIGNNMFAYCGNNPIQNADSQGTFFFTALGAFTGFIGSALTTAALNLVTGSDNDVFTAGINGAVGGAIAGAGVDAALVIIGSCGTALPAIGLAGGVAFMAGGLGKDRVGARAPARFYVFQKRILFLKLLKFLMPK